MPREIAQEQPPEQPQERPPKVSEFEFDPQLATAAVRLRFVELFSYIDQSPTRKPKLFKNKTERFLYTRAKDWSADSQPSPRLTRKLIGRQLFSLSGSVLSTTDENQVTRLLTSNPYGVVNNDRMNSASVDLSLDLAEQIFESNERKEVMSAINAIDITMGSTF
jgi:hypothetical protein